MDNFWKLKGPLKQVTTQMTLLKKNKSKGNMDNFRDIDGFIDKYIKDIFYEKKFKFQKLFNEILKFLEIRLY